MGFWGKDFGKLFQFLEDLLLLGSIVAPASGFPAVASNKHLLRIRYSRNQGTSRQRAVLAFSGLGIQLCSLKVPIVGDDVLFLP